MYVGIALQINTRVRDSFQTIRWIKSVEINYCKNEPISVHLCMYHIKSKEPGLCKGYIRFKVHPFVQTSLYSDYLHHALHSLSIYVDSYLFI
jgi:hypothetical protein